MNLHSTEKPIIVSLCASATATACTNANPLDLLQKIRAGDWAQKVGELRGAFAASGKDAANTIKRTLPAVTWSGLFTVRRKTGFVRHSGLIAIDVDHVADPVALRIQLAADPHCVGAFISPSAEGLKGVFAVDPSKPHAESWRALDAYCKVTFGVEIDPACKDTSRLCFMSYDPDAYIAPGEVACIPYPEPEPPPPAHVSIGPQTPGEAYNERGAVSELLRKHGWTSDDETFWTRPGKDPSAGTSATLGEVDGPPRSFWVFSSNAPPFVPNKRYEPWQVFAMLECGGNFAAATAELQQQGFGPAGDDAFLILPSACGLTISESASKIFATISGTLTIFTRGRVAHEVVTDEHGARLEPITPRAFRSRLEKHGRLMAWRADRDGRRKLSPALCAEETASALLATTEARELLPAIRAILATPALALQGTDELATLGHGWNPHNGGLFVTGREMPSSVPITEAVASLSALLDDFDFQSHGDRARAFASMLTPALKSGGLLNGTTPIEVVEADKSQSGKGFLRKLVAALYAETPSIVTQREGGVGSLDEAVASALIAGRPFVQLDNLRGKVGSTYLEAILTADGPVPCREPHKTTVEVDVRTYVFSLTSNGVEVTRDLANRCSIVRIRKRASDYFFRQFPEGGLLEHVKRRQPYYLGCIHAVAGQWFMSGCLRTSENRHDFRQWAQSLDHITTQILGAGPLLEGHNAARDRVSDQGQTWLRAISLALVAEGRVNCDIAASSLAESSGEHDIQIPNCRADLGELDRARAVGKVMAKIFAETDGVQIEGLTVTRSRKYSPAAQKDVLFYQFSPT